MADDLRFAEIVHPERADHDRRVVSRDRDPAVVDRDRDAPRLPAGLPLDPLDRLLGQRFLRRDQVGLHLLRLAHHLVELLLVRHRSFLC